MRPSESRRDFLKRVGAMGAVFAIAPLAGCARREADAPEAGSSEPAPPSDPCADLSGLTEKQKEFRTEAGYVAQTENPEERCDNCAFWVPSRGGAPCGGCTVLDGPFHPAGWCELWEGQA